MNSMAENYIRYGLDPVESVPVHLAFDVTLWLFEDWSSVVEYRDSGRLIVQDDIGGTCRSTSLLREPSTRFTRRLYGEQLRANCSASPIGKVEAV